jgi:predicted N-formylglutamate amidohydrolase
MPVTARSSPRLLFTCEHGGNAVPPAYRAFFRGAGDVLKSHRGWDPGALVLAERFAEPFRAKLFYSTTTRLLVELNRSLHHPKLFSDYTRDLSREMKQQILDGYYLPHRQAVERYIASEIAAGRSVLHIGVHSFTPELNGEVRKADIGLLYDPQRTQERQFCAVWRAAILAAAPDLRVRKNYPYLGTADGFTTCLRKQFADADYAGIELEVNQRYPLQQKRAWRRLQKVLIASLSAATAAFASR